MVARVTLLSILGLALAVLALVAVAGGGALYEVAERGRDLLPYEAGKVYELHLFDRVTLYVDAEMRNALNEVTGSLLVAAGSLALMGWWLALRQPMNHRMRQLLLFAGIGLVFLGLDEMLGIHETVGHNLRWLAELPGVDRPDDVIFAMYSIPALAFLVRFGGTMAAIPGATPLLVGALGCFGLAAIFDIAGVRVDEAAEMLGSVLLLALSARLTRGALRNALVDGSASSEPDVATTPNDVVSREHV